MSEYSTSPSDHHHDVPQPPKRKATQAGLDGNGNPHGRSVKRRASKACQCCRSRKVRCNVTEHGAPCTNCRLDEVECIVSESRRKKSVHSTSSFRWPVSHVLYPDLSICEHMSSCQVGVELGAWSLELGATLAAACDGPLTLATTRTKNNYPSLVHPNWGLAT